jgi:hypothetical protein
MRLFVPIKKFVRWSGITLFWVFEILGLPRMPENPPKTGREGV